MWSYDLVQRESIRLSLSRFQTKVPRRHPKVEPFDLFFSAQICTPHTYMKAKAPCIERWPLTHVFVLASPLITMKYCTNQLHPA